jgi:hypothetical protein
MFEAYTKCGWWHCLLRKEVEGEVCVCYLSKNVDKWWFDCNYLFLLYMFRRGMPEFSSLN